MQCFGVQAHDGAFSRIVKARWRRIFQTMLTVLNHGCTNRGAPRLWYMDEAKDRRW